MLLTAASSDALPQQNGRDLTMTEQDELLLLRATLRAADYGTLLSDRTRQDLLCNQRFTEMFGLDDKILRRSPEEVRAIILPRLQDPDEFVRVLDAVYADPHLIREDEVRFLLPKPRLVRRYTAPVTDPEGRIIGRLWTFLDITRTRALEDKVKAQAEQLQTQARALTADLKTVSGRLHKVESVLSETQQQLMETEKLSVVGLLAASVAHDIRNILTPLKIEMTLADQDSAAARAESLSVIQQQVDRLSLLTHRLLALAKPAQPEREEIDIGALLERIATLLTPQATTENVVLQVKRPRSLSSILGDATQIDQVLVNLALNAVQAMHATGGGTLTLSVSERDSGLTVQVRDTGTGIARSIRKHLFDPFFTTKPDGAGLGLYSCRRIIEEHGGCLRVRSTPGQGTQFFIRLPVYPGSSSGDVSHGR